MRFHRLQSIVSKTLFFAFPITLAAACAATAAPKADAPAEPSPAAAGGLPTIAKATAGLEKKEGLLDLYFDRQKGKVWLEVPPPSGPRGEAGTYLYVESLLTGLGSNPVGLDRGQLGSPRLVTLRRLGGRLLVEQPNLKFRALSDNPDELQAVRESFATSVLWAGDLTAVDPDGRGLVDVTSFLVRDAHDVATRMRNAEQGSWSLDPGRSAVDFDNCLAFPENLELEALLTYQSNDPGRLVRETAPTGGAVTLVQHHSLLKLPEPGYVPRLFDPRAGSYAAAEFLDYAAPLAAPIETRWIARFRLEKTDPAAARSTVKKPIVFYVDPGAPEPVRSALVEGADWWQEAFEKAGFVDAYRVELLPPGAHPLDVRYNVIQWVHRSTRGWSYGGGVYDPRTGEILKGQVTLGSLRVRQDRLLFEGLADAERSGKGGPDDPVELALARIRQLAAHEVGHALGLNHNFAASTYGGRASVMDYPAPLVGIEDGKLDFSSAYAAGVGEWDVHAIRWAYSQFPPGTDEAWALDAIAREGIGRGLLFLTDEDARALGSAHPLAHLWDNGPDPVAGLRQALAVRRIALGRFGAKNLAEGRPLALLEEVLVPVYFHHRYQIEAAVKVVGGLEYTYALRGDGQAGARPVDGAWQRRALAAVLETISPEVLDLPDPAIALLVPRPAGYLPNREMFTGWTAPTFDPLGAAASAADMAVQALLQPERAARLVDFHRREPKLPGFGEVLDALVEAAFAPPEEAEGPRRAELRRVVQWVVARRLIGLSDNPQAAPGVRARVDGTLAALERRLRAAAGDREGAAHRAFLAREIQRFLERRPQETGPRPTPPEPPPGQPIGMPDLEWVPDPLGGCSWSG